jgi:hypothetical protein
MRTPSGIEASEREVATLALLAKLLIEPEIVDLAERWLTIEGTVELTPAELDQVKMILQVHDELVE